MGSPKRGKLRARRAVAPPPATDGLTSLDRTRAASLADEGGAAGASVEAPDSPPATASPEASQGTAAKTSHASTARSERGGARETASLLCELSIIPLGSDIHLSDELAEVLEVIDASGLSYQLGPAGTCIEGSWEQVMPVVRACHDRARSMSKHVITILKIEDDEGQRNKIRRNVESVESKAGRALSTSNACATPASSRR